MDMSKFKKYSSAEVYEVAEMAKAKGLVLLEGSYQADAYSAYYSNDCKGYCVAVVVAGQFLTLRSDNSVFQARSFPGNMSGTVQFKMTLAEAKELIMKFDGTIKNPPAFFAYIRLYDGEPEFYAQLQLLYLEEFARRNGIVYKHKFAYLGETPDVENYPGNKTGIDNVLYNCEESFSLIGEDDFLVVSDISRIDNQRCVCGNSFIWQVPLNIIAVTLEDMGYVKHYYRCE